MTARVLYGRLMAGGFVPTVSGRDLVIDPAPPPELDIYLRVLHTGVRSILSGITWYGSTSAVARKPLVIGLSPTKPIPATIGLLSVAGDGQWDRIPAWAVLDRPELFEPQSRGRDL